jgi:hypothetical protein
MRYTERLEALEFAIACVTTVHDGIVKRGGSQMNHQDNATKCDCSYGVTIFRLRDEVVTTRCAIEAVAKRSKKGSGSKKVVTSRYKDGDFGVLCDAIVKGGGL